MNEQDIRAILGEARRVDGCIDSFGSSDLVYTTWWGGEYATLDGKYTADQLEAIAWWMRHASIAEVQS
jgi:hypothetical protein